MLDTFDSTNGVSPKEDKRMSELKSSIIYLTDSSTVWISSSVKALNYILTSKVILIRYLNTESESQSIKTEFTHRVFVRRLISSRVVENDFGNIIYTFGMLETLAGSGTFIIYIYPTQVLQYTRLKLKYV
jgi:hypothetical protein